MPDIATRLGTTTTGQLLVRSGIEIERILNTLAAERATLTAKLPDVVFLSRLVAFDAVQQSVMIAYSDHKPANAAVLGCRSVILMCNQRGAQFAFSCAKPRQVAHAGEPAIRMEAPKMMLAMQPRHGRSPSRLPREADVRCEFWVGVISFEVRLVDASLDGRAFLLGDPAIPVCAGTRVQGARISADGREPIVVDLEIDNVMQAVMTGGKRATRIGCRIAAERDKLDKLAGFFIVDLQ